MQRNVRLQVENEVSRYNVIGGEYGSGRGEAVGLQTACPRKGA